MFKTISKWNVLGVQCGWEFAAVIHENQVSLGELHQCFLARSERIACPSHPNKDGAFSVISMPISSSISLMLEKMVFHVTLMTIPHWLRYTRAQQIVLVDCTLADKAWQDVLRSSTVRYCSTSPDVVADLSEFTTHYPTSEDFLSASKKSANVQRPLEEHINKAKGSVQGRIDPFCLICMSNCW